MTDDGDFSRFSRREAATDQLRSRSVQGAAALAFGTGGETLLRLASIVVLARLILPEEFGLVGMVTALTAVAGTLSQLGLATPTVQRQEIEHGQVSNLFWIGIALGAVLTTLFVALAWPIAAFYGEPDLVLVTLALSSSFVVASSAMQHEALLIRTMQQPRTAFVRFIATLISGVVAISLASAGAGVWALISQEIIRTIVVSGGLWLACSWRPAAPDRRHDVRSHVRFGAHLTLTQLLYIVGSNLDKLLVGKMFGAGVLGLYRQAQQLVLVPIDQLNAPIASVAQPGLSVLQDEPDRYRRYYCRIVAIIGLVTMPVAAFAMMFARELTVLIFGANWAAAAPFVFIFAAAAFFRPVLGTTTAVLISRGRSLRLLQLTVVSQGTYLVLVGLGALRSAESVALAHLVTLAVLLLPTLLFAFRDSPVKVRDFLASVVRPLTASAAMVASLGLYRQLRPGTGGIAWLGLATVVAAIVYCAFYLLLPGGRAEAHALLADFAVLFKRRGAAQRADSGT